MFSFYNLIMQTFLAFCHQDQIIRLQFVCLKIISDWSDTNICIECIHYHSSTSAFLQTENMSIAPWFSIAK